MGLAIFHKTFSDVYHVWSECEKYSRLFRGMMPVPYDIVMDLNHGMPSFDLTNKNHEFLHYDSTHNTQLNTHNPHNAHYSYT